MTYRLSIFCLILACIFVCSTDLQAQLPGPVAKFGTTPTIDGQFEPGEWDDAEIVPVGEYTEFRVKHDESNLYLGISAGGGNLWIFKNQELHVLHWSAQLGSTQYFKSDSLTYVLTAQPNYELLGLQNESPEVIIQTLMDYLAENGWTSNIAFIGDNMQSEMAISFEWLGINIKPGCFVATPGIHISADLILALGDPLMDTIMAMPLEERLQKYPPLYWPEGTIDNPLNMGPIPDTIHYNPEDFRTIWIDMQN